MTSFQELPNALKDFLTNPQSNLFVSDFLTIRNKNSPELSQKVSEYIDSCIYGYVSIDEMLTKIKLLTFIKDSDAEDFFAEFLEILGEEGLDELEKYSFNIESLPTEISVVPNLSSTTVPKPVKEIERNPEIVQTKLLQVLETFNLHVDEKGIVAHEVERYLKGDVSSKDLVPHLTAMLDKPLSEVSAIVTALNFEIFKPIQKQIAEEGTLDISYDDDTSLQNFLVQKKSNITRSSIATTTNTQKENFKKISFLPKNISREVSQQEKDAVVSNLRAQGGTPSGASLFSQEKQKNTFTFTPPSLQSKDIDIMPKVKKEIYTIDPYRENF